MSDTQQLDEEKSTERTSLNGHFWTKSILIVFIGMTIWYFSGLIYGGYFFPAPIPSNYIFLLIILSIFLFGFSYYAAVEYRKKYRNITAIILFFAFSWSFGMLLSPIMQGVSFYIGIELTKQYFSSCTLAGIFGAGGCLLVGLFVRKTLNYNYLVVSLLFILLFFSLGLTIAYLSNLNLGVILASFIIYIFIFGIIMWEGHRLPTDTQEDFWMYAVVMIYSDILLITIRLLYEFVRAAILSKIWGEREEVEEDRTYKYPKRRRQRRPRPQQRQQRQRRRRI